MVALRAWWYAITSPYSSAKVDTDTVRPVGRGRDSVDTGPPAPGPVVTRRAIAHALPHCERLW
jgi:hypothetical protein